MAHRLSESAGRRLAVPEAAITSGRFETYLWLLTGTVLRVLPLTENRFHPDEALYASFARLIASGRDPWLASVVVDKPPFPFYLMAASMTLFGPTEFAARLPNLFASVTSIALLCALARALYGEPAAALAGLFFGLSPFAISFAVTAFTDPLQVALLLWAALAAARRRWGWAGLAAGFALATKQTTIVFLPLILGLALGPARRPASDIARRLLLVVAVFLLSAALVSFWDFSRRAAIGFWAQGLSDNVPSRLAYSAEVWPRLKGLGQALSFVTASPPINLAALAGIPILIAGRAHHRQLGPAALVDLVIAIFLLLYLGVYWLLAFDLWDRYFLALVPLLCLLLARAAHGLWLSANRRSRFIRRHWKPSLVIVYGSLAGLLLPPALTAAHSGFPIGGDHGAYDGIDDAARYLQTLPKGSVLYDHWLSWEWRYYLFDAAIYMVWMPDPQTLMADLQAFGKSSPRYFVSPSWESDAAMRRAAWAAGFAFQPVHTTRRRDGSISFVVYHLESERQLPTRRFSPLTRHLPPVRHVCLSAPHL